jgi:hypothetical protein
MKAITQAALKAAVSYDPDTGKFTRLRPGPAPLRSWPSGAGYSAACILGGNQYLHRLAWLYVHGRLPPVQIDHINGDKQDNRIANLREASRAENQQNRAIRRDNKSGHVGAVLHKKIGRWSATIRANGARKHLGMFDSAAEAGEAYRSAKRALHAFCPEIRES